MDKNDKDIRKDIEELEKLIEDVKKQNAEEKKQLKSDQKKSQQGVIRINLALEYSTNLAINFIVGFLVNFILFFIIIKGFKLAIAFNDFIYVGLALVFTLFETVMKQYMLKKHVKLVLYSSGLIFFLFNLIFLYAADFSLSNFAFSDPFFPLIFVAIFQFSRMIFKQLYLVSIKILTKKLRRSTIK